jgi:hypothetical protein
MRPLPLMPNVGAAAAIDVTSTTGPAAELLTVPVTTTSWPKNETSDTLLLRTGVSLPLRHQVVTGGQ